jgi:hypothetical protein
MHNKAEMINLEIGAAIEDQILKRQAKVISSEIV